MARPIAKTLAQLEAVEKIEKRDAPKELVVQRRIDGLYIIRQTAGGEVPDELKGMWTSIVKAEHAIANHLITKAQAEAA